MSRSCCARRRRGFSLLEILLALAILGGSLAVLGQIAETGSDAAREARDLAICRILCQSKLNELLLAAETGVSPPALIDAPLESFDSSSITSYTHSIDVQPAPLDGLVAIRVSVKALESDGTTAIAGYALTRWMVDPTLGLRQAELDERDRQAEWFGAEEEW